MKLTREARDERILALRRELEQLERERAEEALAKTSGSLREACRALIGRGLHIEAIKHYRTISGCSLLEAKYAVEAMHRP